MEGGGFGLANLRNYPPYRPSPPLTAIDRFLWGQKENILVHNNGIFYSSSNSCNDYINSCLNSGGILWPSGNNETSFLDGFLLDIGDHDINPNLGLNDIISESIFLVEKNGKGVDQKKVKGGYSINLIKGQWTEEEDRKLVKLVKQHGVRRWARIAEEIVGRAGKQCRDRWNNHLRPNIKKDSWSEEEERMLIEAHMKVGNKWAEIAKRIPRRTENSIKNHWNATKRRQNSRRKTKKNQNAQNAKTVPQPSLLQDYMIKSNILNDNTTTITTPANSTISDDLTSNNYTPIPDLPSEESHPLISSTYDEELNFMISLFANKPNEGLISPTMEPISINNNEHGYNKSFVNHEPTSAQLGKFANEELPKNYMYSDLYVSYLLEGGSCALGSTDHSSYGGMNMAAETNNGEGVHSSGIKEMDLIEMVSSSQFYQAS